MPLTPGTRLGPYEILAPIGAGGMGEVYKARDTRLDRIVALKVSKTEFSERFEREARAVAALNHSNICTLHDVGPDYLVMEYIEGTPLKGPLPLDQALKYAVQICDALDAAHKKGITHRDLKPANILVTKNGIKLLDFGLAKIGPVAASPGDATLTMALTGKNEIVGTLYYMSPEQLQAQATGQEIDGRSDIFSFGLVLYEMLTGRRAFEGTSPASVIAAIMERPAPSIANIAPPALDRVLKKCLAKDPDERWQTARDLKDELEWIASGSKEAGDTTAPLRSRAGSLPWLLTGAFAVVALALAAIHFREKPPVRPAIARFQIRIPENAKFTSGGTFVLSPDGQHVAFSAVNPKGGAAVWIQDLEALEARELSATYTGGTPPPFFWSPDSRYVAYSENSPKLKKVDITTGAAQEICDKPGPPIGGSWNKDGVIIFGSNTAGLWQVPAAGGAPVALTKLNAARNEREHELPSFLPDGHHFLYLRISPTKPEENGIFAGSIDDPPEKQSEKRLLATGFGVQYVPGPEGSPGWLLFLRNGTLMAQAFDPASLTLAGEPSPITEGVGSVYETGYFSAASGALVYRTSRAVRDYQLTWFDQQGKVGSTAGEPGSLTNARFSPDGTRVAFRKAGANFADQDIWVLDLKRDTSTRLTFGPQVSEEPVWSPDGTEIVFTSNRSGSFDLYRKPANGATEERLLLRSDENKMPESWSPDGRFLLYATGKSATFSDRDMWVLPMQGPDRTPFPFQQTRFDEGGGRFSPDGRWVAYESDESGRYEVYVREFNASASGAGTGGKWQVSKDGGYNPRWRSDGKELVYVSPSRIFVSVNVDAGKMFQSSSPKVLFAVPPGTSSTTVTGDLQRFLIAIPVETKEPQAFNVMLNWTSLIKPK